MAGSQMQLEDWLDDLCVRFIINLPEEDLSSVARICFQIEEAQWFYEDFIRPLDPSLPSMSLRTFSLRIFQHCPLLASFSIENHTQAFEEFLQYKTRVPVRGAILLNHDMDATVLVKGWKKGANWSFPRGKINKDEDDLDCAVREVWEETGLDLRAAGLVPSEAKPKYIEITMREQQMRLYVFRDVPMDTNFQPQTRKEISKIQWYKLSELPAFRKKGAQTQSDAGTNANKFYMVAPFLVPLKKWVLSQKKIEAKKLAMTGNRNLDPHFSLDEGPTEDDAWPQATRTLSMQNPALNTLEGATNELQSLLKVQPPTHGLQSATSREDKASALLSMLQVKDPAVVQQLQPQQQSLPPSYHSQVPHTPHGTMTGEIPQPRNPHHHPNQHHIPLQTDQPPPPFHIQQQQPQSQNQYPPSYLHSQGPSWNADQHHHPAVGKVGPQGFDGASQHPQRTHQAPLVHPQPLPPQVQRAMFNNSSFQENPQNALPRQPQPVYGQAPPMPPAANGPVHQGQPVRLDGQSMALLNAFKRDTGNYPSTQLVQPGTNQLGYGPAQPAQFVQQSSALQSQTQPPELAGSMTQKAPAVVARPEASAPGDQHRSALLGMFNRDQVDANSHGTKVPTPRSQLELGAKQQQLLNALQHGPTGPNPMSKSASQSSNPSAALSDFLALRPRADQQPGAGSVVSDGRQPSTGSNTHTAPVRILQRGQGADALAFGAPRPDHLTSHTTFSQHSHPESTTYTSPQMRVSQPSPSSSQKRPEVSQDQKRQLLSLFGKQQQQPILNTAIPDARDVISGQASPAQPGSGTPMSPAEQTFLLDYLQSVTNSATR